MSFNIIIAMCVSVKSPTADCTVNTLVVPAAHTCYEYTRIQNKSEKGEEKKINKTEKKKKIQ